MPSAIRIPTSLLFVAIIAMIAITPKAYYLPLAGMALLSLAWLIHQKQLPQINWSLMVPLLAFFGFGMLSVTWSIFPKETISSAGKIAAITMMAPLLFHLAQRSSQAALTIAGIITIAMVAYMGWNPAYWAQLKPLLTEYLGNYDFIENRHNDQTVNINRSLTIASMVAFAVGALLWQKAKFASPILLAIFAYLVFHTTCQSATLGMFAGGFILLLSSFAPIFTNYLLRVGLILSFLVVVPFFVADKEHRFVQKMGLEQLIGGGGWNERIILYEGYSQKVLEQPLAGRGFAASKAAPATEEDKKIGGPFVYSFDGELRLNKPHSLHLQILFEIGFLGAGIFCWLAWNLLSFARQRFDRQTLPFVHATFAACIANGLFNFIVWRMFFTGAIIMAMALLVPLMIKRDQATHN